MAAVWFAFEVWLETSIFGSPNGLSLLFLAYPAFWAALVWFIYGQDQAWLGAVIGFVAAWITFIGLADQALRQRNLKVPSQPGHVFALCHNFDDEQLKFDIEARGFDVPRISSESRIDGFARIGKGFRELQVVRVNGQPPLDPTVIQSSLIEICEDAKGLETISVDTSTVTYESSTTYGRIDWQLVDTDDKNVQAVRVWIREEPKEAE